MLILNRRLNEVVVINGDTTVQVLAIHHSHVRLGFVAPRDVPIHRQEIQEQLDREGRVHVNRKMP